MNKYTEILQKVPEDKRKIGDDIAKEVVFIKATLDDLKRKVKKDGVVSQFGNGAVKESPLLKEYNYMIQRYSQMCKQLLDLIPKEEAEQKDALMDFVGQ